MDYRKLLTGLCCYREPRKNFLVIRGLLYSNYAANFMLIVFEFGNKGGMRPRTRATYLSFYSS